MTNLIEDLAVLTDVQETLLRKFAPIAIYSIGHAVHESRCCKEDITIIDLSIGELHIKVEEDTLRYRFVPSKELDKTLKTTLQSKESPIVARVNASLQEKIERSYKELL